MNSPDDTRVKRLDKCHLKQKEAYNPHSNLVLKHFFAAEKVLYQSPPKYCRLSNEKLKV
jgi:hypothetical protein